MLFAPFLDKGSGAFYFPFRPLTAEPRASHGSDTRGEAGGAKRASEARRIAAALLATRNETLFATPADTRGEAGGETKWGGTGTLRAIVSLL